MSHSQEPKELVVNTDCQALLTLTQRIFYVCFSYYIIKSDIPLSLSHKYYYPSIEYYFGCESNLKRF